MSKKKILDADTKNWPKEDVDKIIPHLKKYKYQVEFKLPDGKIRFAYTNNELELVKEYFTSIDAKILGVSKIGSTTTD